MRRKRRSNGLWFPVIGTDGGTDAGDYDYRAAHLEYQTGTAFGGGAAANMSVVVVNGLTFDKPVQPEETGGQYDLQALIGNSYFLKRIVGKLSLLPFSNADAGAPAFIKIGAAFYVARQEEQPADVSANVPVGWSQSVGFPGMNYDCLAAHCANDPWIWRRTWILPNVGQTAADRWTAGPVSNTAFGSVLDGGHVDAKTKRVVKQDERLWFTTSVQPWPLVPGNRTSVYADISGFVMVDLDYRIFAQPIRARKSGSF